MSGHNKWSKIHRKKAIQDQKKGGLFTKLGRNITLAVKKGGSGDPETNFALRLAVEKARAASMPKENIQRAIQRGLGKSGDSGEVVEVVLEGYGPEGVGVIVEAITDNRNRTVAEVKNVFDKGGGSLAEPGSVMYQFERKGVIRVGEKLADGQLLGAIDLGVEETEEGEEEVKLIVEPDRLKEVIDYLGEVGVEKVEAGVEYRAKIKKTVGNREAVERLLTKLREMDDVQEVYANWES